MTGPAVRARLETAIRSESLPGALALASAAVLLLASLSVLHGIVDAVGEPTRFGLLVAAALVAATALSRVVRVRVGLGVGGLLFVGGMAWYLVSAPQVPDLPTIVASNVQLLTGRTLLAMEAADVLALVVAVPLVLVTWFLALRGWYVAAAGVGGGTVGYLVLTGDAGTTVTLVGIVATMALVGFGDLDRREASLDAAEQLAAVIAVMVVAPLFLTVVPSGAASPATFDGVGAGGGSGTIESNVVTTGSDLEIAGSIELSPKVRFTVTSSEPRYWRTGSFDRYTGSGWVNSGEAVPYEEGILQEPPGPSKTLTQEYDVESTVTSLPAAWRPTAVGPSVADRTSVTSDGSLRTDRSLGITDSYEVESTVPDPSSEELSTAGVDYPEEIEERYTQLPESTPDRVGERTAEIIEDADNPHEAALIIEQWLKTNREYSLDVERPDGDIADAVLFEMDAAYCTYYATTMATMLRTQGIPARLAVGYTSGQQVAEDRWVVRGLDSHAWVEVYYPDVGWIQFDPTPADPRQQAENTRLQDARANDEPNVDTRETFNLDPNTTSLPTPSGNGTVIDIPETDDDNLTTDLESNGSDETPAESTNATESEGGGVGGFGDRFALPAPPSPSRTQLALGAVALVGAVAGVRQSGLARRARRFAALRYQQRSDPATDIERAYDRLHILLEQRHRPRRTGETVRQYLAAVDAGPEARRVAELRERARYGNAVSEAAADEAVELVDRLHERGSDE